MASRGREQVGVDVGAGIGFGVATGAEHHAIVEGAQAEASVIGEGAVGTKGLVRAVGEECQQAFPAVSHPEGAVVTADSVKGLQGTPGEGVVGGNEGQRCVEKAYNAVDTHGQTVAVDLQRTQLATHHGAVSFGGLPIERALEGTGAIAYGQKAVAHHAELADGEGVETMVRIPTVADAGVAFADRKVLQAFARGGIDTISAEGQVVDRRISSAGAKIPCFLDFHALQVEHHHPEARGQIGVALPEADMVDFLVARYFAALDVGEVVGDPFVDDVDIGIVVGHDKALRGVVVGHRGDAHVVQSVALAHGRQRAVADVVAKHTADGSGIDAVAGIGQMCHPRVVEARTPFPHSRLRQHGVAHEELDCHEQRRAQQSPPSALKLLDLFFHTVVSFFKNIYWYSTASSVVTRVLATVANSTPPKLRKPKSSSVKKTR